MLRPVPIAAPGSGLITAFPILALIGTGVALAFPEYVLILKPAIVPLLGVVMFGMGLTLRAEDFLAVLARPGVIALGIALQFALMPMLAWVVGKAMVLDIEPFIGLILLGACPGGTASNVICYLARANVALSITLTAVSTLLAVLFTPYLTFFFAGHLVPVPMGAMLLSILKIVVAPVAAGVVLNHLIGRYLRRNRRDHCHRRGAEHPSRCVHRLLPDHRGSPAQQSGPGRGLRRAPVPGL
jgi:BASS family bile acid:Na+ symporter